MSFIQNLFTSRDNNSNSATYVGQQDRLWWDPVTNRFYYSDGNTPGGFPVGGGGNVTTDRLVNGAFEFVLTPTGNVTAPGSILPSANVSYDLGSPTNAWRSLYISGNTLYIANENMSVNPSTGVWNFTSNGANINLGANSTFANIAVNIASANAISVSGNITTQGAVSASGNVTVGNLTVTGKINSSFIPSESNVHSLGNSTNRWANLWLTGTTIYLGNSIIDSTPDGSTVNILTANAALANVVAGNVTTGGLVSASGNITGNYFVGNGSQLTGISVSSNKIFNGNSYANISAASGNVEINANGQSWLFGTSGNLTLPGNTVSINYANGTPYGGAGSSLPPQTGNVGKILSTNGTSPLWETMPGVFGLVIDGGDAAFASLDFIIDGGPA